jgi:hypothetical protein
MTIYDQPNLSSGIDDALVELSATVPVFTPMLLVFVYFLVLITGMVSQKARTGTADAPLWFTLSGIATLMVALPLTITGGLIQLEVLAVVVVVTIGAGLWLFTDKNRNEL